MQNEMAPLICGLTRPAVPSAPPVIGSILCNNTRHTEGRARDQHPGHHICRQAGRQEAIEIAKEFINGTACPQSSESHSAKEGTSFALAHNTLLWPVGLLPLMKDSTNWAGLRMC